MKRKSPISIDRIQFYLYGRDEKDDLMFIDQFHFDDRHDFAANRDSCGLAVKFEVSNKRFDKGARRNVSFSLVNMTLRVEVAKQYKKICVPKDESRIGYIIFPELSPEHVGGCTYKLVVSDTTSCETIGENIIHFYDKSVMGNPEKWYDITDGGIRPCWERSIYKSLNTVDKHDYLVQFNVSSNIGVCHPTVMPELEIRLYYPDGARVCNCFKEPFCHGIDNYDDNRWTVECPFETTADANGVFYAELLCMDCPVAGFVFDTTSSNDIIGKWYGHEMRPIEKYTPEAVNKLMNERMGQNINSGASIETDSLDDMIDRFIASEYENLRNIDNLCTDSSEAENEDERGVPVNPLDLLDHLTGLESVKEKLRTYEHVVHFNRMRRDIGLPISSTPLHAMFLGSPGTGKTTVAKLFGEMLYRGGVLSKGHVVVRERATLIGQYYNSEAEKTIAAIEEAQGGVLFIDEAYQLYQPNDSRDPGKFVIETLLTALADDSKRDWMLILAGYPEEMKRMFDMNPGFKSRIPDSNIYVFEDFTESELMEIAEKYLDRNCYSMTKEAYSSLAHRLRNDYAQRGKNFGNARHVVNLIQTEILPSMAVRVVNEGSKNKKSLTEITSADIPSPVMKPLSSRSRLGFAC